MATRTGYNSEDDSARTAVAGQIAAVQTALQSQINSLSGGGDPEVITALQTAVDALEASQATLSTAVAGKADAAATTASLAARATVTALTDGLAAKATTTALSALSDTVSGLSAALAGKASTTALSDGLATKASTTSVSDLSAVVADKADATATTAALALKADTAAMISALAGKASTTSLTDGLAAKADASALTSGLAAKADTSALTSGLAAKADVSALTSGLAAKADSSALTSGLAAKADAAATTAALATKAPSTDVTADRARLSLLEARPQFRQARGAVVFTWDDGWSTHPTIAQMHADRGQAATFYITSNLLGTSQHMAGSDVAAIQALGHEIGCHSADHTDMKTLTAVTRAAQWASKATIEALMSGGKQITSYAYPLGNNDVTCNQEAYGRFDRVAAIGLSQGYYTGTSGYAPWLYDLDTEVYRHGRFPWSQTTHTQFMALLKDHVRRRPVILTAYAHQMGNPDTPTQAMIEEAMNYCQANGIPCITTAQALPGPKVVNPGFESDLDGWTVINAGAAATGTTVDVITDAPGAGLSGTKSLRIISPNTTTTADSVHVFQTLPARPLTAYSLSARIRHDGTPGGAGTGTSKYSVRINEFNSVGGSIASRSVRGNISTGSWAQSSCTLTTADATNYVALGHTHPDCRYVTIGLYIQEYTGTFYADHVHFGPTEDGLLG